MRAVHPLYSAPRDHPPRSPSGRGTWRGARQISHLCSRRTTPRDRGLLLATSRQRARLVQNHYVGVRVDEQEFFGDSSSNSTRCTRHDARLIQIYLLTCGASETTIRPASFPSLEFAPVPLSDNFELRPAFLSLLSITSDRNWSVQAKAERLYLYSLVRCSASTTLPYTSRSSV